MEGSLSLKTSFLPPMLLTCTTGPFSIKNPVISTTVLRDPPPLFLRSKINPLIPLDLRFNISFFKSVAAFLSP